MSARFSDDAFGVWRAAASKIARDLARELLEAWTPETRARIIQHMKSQGAEFVDHKQVGDYDLSLWHYTGLLNFYAVALNSGQEDPTTLDGQARRPKAQYLQWNKVLVQLRDWVGQYGKLLVSSAYPGRTEQYNRLLKRYFLVGEWSVAPEAGFFILPE